MNKKTAIVPQNEQEVDYIINKILSYREKLSSGHISRSEFGKLTALVGGLRGADVSRLGRDYLELLAKSPGVELKADLGERGNSRAAFLAMRANIAMGNYTQAGADFGAIKMPTLKKLAQRHTYKLMGTLRRQFSNYKDLSSGEQDLFVRVSVGLGESLSLHASDSLWRERGTRLAAMGYRKAGRYSMARDLEATAKNSRQERLKALKSVTPAPASEPDFPAARPAIYSTLGDEEVKGAEIPGIPDAVLSPLGDRKDRIYPKLEINGDRLVISAIPGSDRMVLSLKMMTNQNEIAAYWNQKYPGCLPVARAVSQAQPVVASRSQKTLSEKLGGWARVRLLPIASKEIGGFVAGVWGYCHQLKRQTAAFLSTMV